MSGIFISYKSEDVGRITRLAGALESSGFSVWWDRRLPGGENWNTHIRTALEQANCVIVVWTRASVGPDGDFVRDEARVAKQHGRLVPVNLDRVSPPLGFGEIQAVDLSRWKGSTHDVFFQDLIAAVRAKLEGRAVPAPKGPIKRLKQRITRGTAIAVLSTAIGAFGSDTFHVQAKACAAPQAVSDFCGALGFGGRPTKKERLAWEVLRPANCDDLKSYLTRYPDGAYRAKAHSLLVDHRETETPVWLQRERRLALFEGQADQAFRTRDLAVADALRRAQHKSEILCRNFGVATGFRFEKAKPQVERLKCGNDGETFACEIEGQAICQLEEETAKVTETCGQ